MVMCAVVTIMVFYYLGGWCDVVMCAVVTIMVCYSLWGDGLK
jgi:hypothetical protein